MAIDAQSLFLEAKCYLCLGISQEEALELALLNRIATSSGITMFDSGNIPLSAVSVDYTHAVSQFSGVARFVRAVFVVTGNDANIGAPIGAEIPIESAFYENGTTVVYVPLVGLTISPGTIRATTPAVLVGNEANCVFPKAGTGYSSPSSFANFALKLYYAQ